MSSWRDPACSCSWEECWRRDCCISAASTLMSRHAFTSLSALHDYDKCCPWTAHFIHELPQSSLMTYFWVTEADSKHHFHKCSMLLPAMVFHYAWALIEESSYIIIIINVGEPYLRMAMSITPVLPWRDGKCFIIIILLSLSAYDYSRYWNIFPDASMVNTQHLRYICRQYYRASREEIFIY